MHFSTLYLFCPVCGSNKFVQNNIKSKRCESCGFVYFMNPSAAVAAFILNDEGELLVCKRGKEPAKGTLDLPGGFIDDNESAEQAIVREVAEELDAKVIECNYKFSLPNLYLYSGLTIPTLDMFFSCKLEDTKNMKPADDVEDCWFVPINDLNPELFGLNSVSKAIGMFLETSKD
ncbi:MAG: NUDIX domain-containing protein [Paludibacter sp.]